PTLQGGGRSPRAGRTPAPRAGGVPACLRRWGRAYATVVLAIHGGDRERSRAAERRRRARRLLADRSRVVPRGRGLVLPVVLLRRRAVARGVSVRGVAGARRGGAASRHVLGADAADRRRRFRAVRSRDRGDAVPLPPAPTARAPRHGRRAGDAR